MMLTNQYKGFKRRIALMMAFVLFLSNVGISRYEHFCGCSGEVYSSLIIKSESQCCQKQSQATAQPKINKSCCKIGSKSQKAEPENSSCHSQQGKKCCNTAVHYSRLDSNATTHSSAFDLAIFDLIAPSNISIPPYKYAVSPISDSDFLALQPLSFFTAISPPLPSGRLLLQQIQIFRC